MEEEFRAYADQRKKASTLVDRWRQNQTEVISELSELALQFNEWGKDFNEFYEKQFMKVGVKRIKKLLKKKEIVEDKLTTALITLRGAEATLHFRLKYGMQNRKLPGYNEDAMTVMDAVDRLDHYTTSTRCLAKILKALADSVLPSNLARVIQGITDLAVADCHSRCKVAKRIRCYSHSLRCERDDVHRLFMNYEHLVLILDNQGNHAIM